MPETKEVEAKAKEVKEVKKAKAPKASNDELMQKYTQTIQFVQNMAANIETDLKRIHIALNQLAKFDIDHPEAFADIATNTGETKEEVVNENEENMEVIEGVFDGYFMTGTDQKKYPVPMNYSSKTKLVPGDKLKLKILEDGKFIYKLIQPVERKHIRAILTKTEENKFVAITDERKTYFLNQAAVTFFKGKPGDELYILINDKEDLGFAAIEAVIKK